MPAPTVYVEGRRWCASGVPDLRQAGELDSLIIPGLVSHGARRELPRVGPFLVSLMAVGRVILFDRPRQSGLSDGGSICPDVESRPSYLSRAVGRRTPARRAVSGVECGPACISSRSKIAPRAASSCSAHWPRAAGAGYPHALRPTTTNALAASRSSRMGWPCGSKPLRRPSARSQGRGRGGPGLLRAPPVPASIWACSKALARHRCETNLLPRAPCRTLWLHRRNYSAGAIRRPRHASHITGAHFPWSSRHDHWSLRCAQPVLEPSNRFVDALLPSRQAATR